MNYWIVCMTDDNLKISLREKVIGFSESKARLLKSFQSGDLIVFYVSRESLTSTKRIGKLMGLAEVNGGLYRSSMPLWNNGLFPHRIGIEPRSVKSCDIKSLIEKLRFIKNKEKWGTAFMSGILRVPPEDFETIQACMQ
jgi:predicted RNA-binding protein